MQTATPGLVTEVIDLTPDLAREYLATMTRNRSLRQHAVDAYVRDMRAGDWHFTAEPIKFDTNGHLVDGQHRCEAVIRSGVTVKTLVVRGVAPSAQDYMDSGSARTAGDMLGMNGYASGNRLAAAARLAIMYERGDFANGSSITKAEVADYVLANPDLIDAVGSHTVMKGLDLDPRVRYVSWFILARVDLSATATFFDSLSNNATRGKGDPRNALLQRLAQAKRNREQISPEAQLSMVMRTWNAWRRGKSMGKMPTHTSGNVIDIPTPV